MASAFWPLQVPGLKLLTFHYLDHLTASPGGEEVDIRSGQELLMSPS